MTSPGKIPHLFILSVISILLITPSVSSPEIKIQLKNGRSIIADRCRDADGKLICEKADGTFELEKKDIVEMKEITVKQRITSDSEIKEQETPADADKKTTEKSADDTAAAPKSGEGVLIKGAMPEQEKRLDEITKRKLELKDEREKLIFERDKLIEDAKNAGIIRSQEQLDGFRKRISELGGKIIRFNDEVKSLNEEENRISEDIKKSSR
ncbi:MAG: hypothetical protein AB1632_05095 [Nitrospirota bacterium]